MSAFLSHLPAFQLFVFAAFAVILFFHLIRILRYGLKGAMVGRQIEEKVGTVDCARSFMGSGGQVRIYTLAQGDPERTVAVEFDSGSRRGPRLVALSDEEVRQLCDYLKTAVGRSI